MQLAFGFPPGINRNEEIHEAQGKPPHDGKFHRSQVSLGKTPHPLAPAGDKVLRSSRSAPLQGPLLFTLEHAPRRRLISNKGNPISIGRDCPAPGVIAFYESKYRDFSHKTRINFEINFSNRK
ncbi:hypothetical protein CDAR_490301 [Caerostris darwini]|uniref:Uncharacterized protein n=1 Tax=Caerostris darwini TaxID=1538125 RepID=A0AAV4R5B1_9ARAC|nr:hypothetical protein CDAR_490301 [Caerostris darwini]